MICRKCKKEAPDGAFCIFCGTKQEKAEKPKPKRKRGNGQGSVFKRGNSWCAVKTVSSYCGEINGEKKYIRRRITKGGFATKTDAINYLPLLAQTKAQESPKLIELWSRYEKNSLPKLAKSKQSAYKKARERLEDLMGYRINELRTSDMQDTIDNQASSYYTARDQMAMADSYVPANLSKHIVLPDLEETEAIPFNNEEVQKIWAAFADGEWFAGYLLLMIYSGMMPGELFACKKSMINFDRCEIWGCGKRTKKRKKEVPIVFAESVKPVLAVLCEKTEGDLLQPRFKTEWYDEYHEVVKRIGIRDLPPYSCRHTTGTEAAKQNLNASIIQNIMRHAKISTSQRYIHLGAEAVHSGINSI